MSVIQIGDFAIARRAYAWKQQPDECPHNSIELDECGEVVRCDKCKVQISAYWALTRIAGEWERAQEARRIERDRLAKDKAAVIHLIAARRVEQAWRSRTMVPSCPHCHRGIFATDGFGGSSINREIELRRREAEKKA